MQKALFVGCLALCLVVVSYGAWCSAESMKTTDKILSEVHDNKIKEAAMVQVKKSEWKSKKHKGVDLPGPITIIIETPREDGETVAAWQTRHDDAVTAALATNPPVE